MDPRAAPPRSPSSPRSFVGRAAELDELAAGIEEAESGRGRLFLIAGEPGIGKTRLAEEAAALAAARGTAVLWGRSWEGGGAPAYWPWIQVVRGCLRQEAGTAVDGPSAEEESVLAQMLPGLSSADGGELEHVADPAA